MSGVKVDVKEMLAAGVHFGHRASRRHPKMSEYIHSKRNEAHIIDLLKTEESLSPALDVIAQTVSQGKTVLFVGTKRQAKEVIREAAESVDMPYVIQRWLGGMLTNNKTMSSRVKHLLDLEKKMETGELKDRYSKLEVQRFQEEIDRLNNFFAGMKNYPLIPGAIFVCDVIVDANAVREAKRLNIPVIGMCDTNADPTTIDYPIPANDDAVKSIQLITSYITEAVKEGKARQPKQASKTATKSAKSSSKLSASARPADDKPADAKESTKSEAKTKTGKGDK